MKQNIKNYFRQLAEQVEDRVIRIAPDALLEPRVVAVKYARILLKEAEKFARDVEEGESRIEQLTNAYDIHQKGLERASRKDSKWLYDTSLEKLKKSMGDFENRRHSHTFSLLRGKPPIQDDDVQLTYHAIQNRDMLSIEIENAAYNLCCTASQRGSASERYSPDVVQRQTNDSIMKLGSFKLLDPRTLHRLSLS